ncbi:hypothetical protein L208DRAFT_1510240, partial [Tricholoma matsutake]
MQCEEHEWQLDNLNADLSSPEDPFIAEGLSSSTDSDTAAPIARSQTNTRASRLQAGKVHRENLKEKLFKSKAH